MPQQLIRARCSPAERAILLENMWKVVYLHAKCLRILPCEAGEDSGVRDGRGAVALLEELPAPCPQSAEADRDASNVVVQILPRPASREPAVDPNETCD
jgi:hypothetical protein